jgi:LysR family hydrogen peroxide-inducible transcriptional activator
MNLRDFEYLVAVADLWHFGKAAERCNVSQPTLSMQLKKLENYLSVQLFERTNKQVMITKIGEEIAMRARQILLTSNEIKQLAKTAQEPLAGDFTLGAFPTIAPYFLPIIVPKIAENLPKLKLFLVEDKTEILLAKLKAGTLDATLLALPIYDEDLEFAELFSDPFMLAVPTSHKLAKRKFIHPKDIVGEKLLLLEEGHCLRNQALEICSLIGVGERQDFRATSLETLRQMVRVGVGVTLMPEIAVREKDGVCYIPIKPEISRKIALVWRKTSTRKQCIEAMLPSFIRI